MLNLPEFPPVLVWLAPVFVALIIVEILAIRFFKLRGEIEAQDASTSLIMGAGNTFIDGAFSVIALGILLWIYDFRVLSYEFSWWLLPIALIVDDLRFYWHHRIGHRVRWMWAQHVAHHSSQHYNLTTAARQPWSGPLTGLFLLRAPLVLLGLHPLLLVFCGGLNLAYQFWIHTRTIDKMPVWFETIFNTPSHHRVHHGVNARYLDANYAGMLIIWDKVFATFVPETDGDPVRFGIVKNIGTFNPLRVAFHEYVGIFKDVMQSGPSFVERVLYVFGPPGWCHDASRKQAEEIKMDYLARHPEEAGTAGFPVSLR